LSKDRQHLLARIRGCQTGRLRDLLSAHQKGNQQRRGKSSPSVISNFVSGMNLERFSAQVTHDSPRDSQCTDISFERERNAFQRRNGTTHKSHHGMHGGHAGAAPSQHVEFAAG
jgi:hypothetical protein